MFFDFCEEFIGSAGPIAACVGFDKQASQVLIEIFIQQAVIQPCQVFDLVIFISDVVHHSVQVYNLEAVIVCIVIFFNKYVPDIQIGQADSGIVNFSD